MQWGNTPKIGSIVINEEEDNLAELASSYEPKDTIAPTMDVIAQILVEEIPLVGDMRKEAQDSTAIIVWSDLARLPRVSAAA